MNAESFLRRIAGIACLGLIVLQAAGCARWIELMPVPSLSHVESTHLIAQREQVPLYLEQFHLTRNGAFQNPSLEAERRVLGSLKAIGLFSHLGSTGSTDLSLNEKTIRAQVQFDEALDPHPGDAAWKSFIIGASMFVLTPLIPLEYDYAAHVTLELERWDGQIKRYESQSAGTAHYHLFGATPLVIDELKGHVTESCLTGLMQQIVLDTPFFMASSAPLPENPIRSVTVKGRRREPAALPVVPISNSSQK